MITALILVAAAIAVASFAVRPNKARSFDLFYGSVFIDDNSAPVSIDLASGKPTVRLPDAYQQVNAKQPADVDVVPLAGGTLLLDTVTGEFNMIDSTGIVAKSGGGVSVGKTADTTTSTGLASGSSAYIVRTGASGTSVYLVSLSTVTSAIGGGPVRPRASVGMLDPVKDVATTVTANDDLWLLAGAGTSRTIRQLSVPKGTNPGVSLKSSDHGSVTGVAAIGVSTAKTDGSGGDVVAAASSDSIQIFDTSGGSHTLAVKAPSGVDSILPVSNEQGAFAFLYHSSSGWSVVRAATDGSADALVHRLGGIDGTTSLTAPAQSNGSLYTADLSSGALWRIGRNGDATAVPDVGKYPLIVGETSDFSLIKVIAQGARVIFNSRTKLEAVTVFTDGSHKPVVNDKRTAVDLTANGAAAALTNLHHNPPKNTPGPPKPRIDPAQQVTDKINCQAVRQIPHIPTLDLVDRGSRSVQLHWDYPLLDRQDCAPSTYTVTVKLLSDNAPSAPTLPPIQGSNGVNVTGLFPDTQYSFVVTAYINGQGTPSAPLPVRTSIEGPAPPANVHATVDDQGNWLVTWNSCGGIQNSCVPAGNWTIIPQLCDGAGGLVSAPANMHIVGDPTSHTFSLVYRGNGSLLGRGLSFEVAGIGLKGTTGTASIPSNCAYSWAQPIPANIHVAASVPPGGTTVGGSTSATVTVGFTGDQNVALGGVGGQLTYQLLSGGSVVTTQGPTSNISVSLAGILPGQSYSVRVLVSPPKHPTASVSLPEVAVQAAVANWPTLTVAPTFVASDAANGVLKVEIGGVRSSDARGETFDLTNSGLDCGNTHLDLTQSSFDPGTTTLSFPIARASYNGSCQVTVQLTENASTRRSPAYFGGNPSHSTSGPVTIPVPTLDTTEGQFSAKFTSSGILSTPQITVADGGGNSLLATYSHDWHIQAQYKDGGAWTTCGSESNANLGQQGATTTIDITSCYYSHQSANWQATVDFTYFSQSPTPAYQVPVNGNGPQPVDPKSMSFTAAWIGNNIALDYSGPYDQNTLDQLNWTIQVNSSGSPGQVCNDGEQPGKDPAPRQYGTLTLPVSLTTCPAKTGGSASPPSPPIPSTYTVRIHFMDPNYGTTGDYTIDKIDGTPPS